MEVSLSIISNAKEIAATVKKLGNVKLMIHRTGFVWKLLAVISGNASFSRTLSKF